MKFFSWVATKFHNFANYIHGVTIELRRVIWPTRKETVNQTMVVIAMVVLVAVVLGLLDYGFARLIGWLTSL
jgi:preprotein translocase subunit SecE